MTLRTTAFRSCLTIASCATIPARITRDPATTVINSSLDKKQMLNRTRIGGSFGLPSSSCDNLALESRSCDASSVTT
jgi:starvation-inducible outer membrane lipoprotein